MSDAVTHSSSPVMDSSRYDDVEKAVSSDSTPKGVVMTWQLKALLAGRTPLPSSRPKRKSDEMESPESSDHLDNPTLEDAPSAKCVDGSHNKDDKETTTVSHVPQDRKETME
ncbi:hypothetical protein TGAMA5MH_08359 [Trichoderma gamsii]|uniref:Uncharacterized protein n=1 Tax=Trichoderma gamsii TaxID=398673 RepID=A0A2K0T2D6_9HYPO|nr:hypothetical protein TGAMA5MH_08359 [Trichoderma gamsii]